jgi:alpha-beta hydrolase superfamily lysophospholipase
VDKVDALRRDDALQASHIERHRERILGRRREADEETTDRLQFAGKPMRIRRHQSARASFRERSGDGERRAFVAAGGKRGNDLKNRPAGERRVGPPLERRESVEAHGLRLEHESLTGEELTRNDGSAKSAPLRAAVARLTPARSASGVTKSEPSVSDGQPQVFIVGNAPNQRRIAFRRRAPVRDGGPGLVWLCGYRSDMDSTKASALDTEAERRGLALLRFDYSGHGKSDGRLEDGTVSRWLEEALALIRAQSEGPQVLVGSSMGGYLALLVVRALNAAGEADRVKGLILIAPAVDFTEALIWAKASEEARRAIMDEGVWRRPSAYSSEPDCFTRDLIEDGRKHLLLSGMIRTNAPTAVLQGMMDEAVPFSHALALMQRLGGDPATLTLVKDGDHRLSRPQDLQLMFDALDRMTSVDLSRPG